MRCNGLQWGPHRSFCRPQFRYTLRDSGQKEVLDKLKWKAMEPASTESSPATANLHGAVRGGGITRCLFKELAGLNTKFGVLALVAFASDGKNDSDAQMLCTALVDFLKHSVGSGNLCCLPFSRG